MFAAVKTILALVIACGSVIAAIVESTHPGFVACICAAFAVGAIAGESLRFHRQRIVRWPARWIPVLKSLFGAGKHGVPELPIHGRWIR